MLPPCSGPGINVNADVMSTEAVRYDIVPPNPANFLDSSHHPPRQARTPVIVP